jgi:hypothetical protein
MMVGEEERQGGVKNGIWIGGKKVVRMNPMMSECEAASSEQPMPSLFHAKEKRMAQRAVHCRCAEKGSNVSTVWQG